MDHQNCAENSVLCLLSKASIGLDDQKITTRLVNKAQLLTLCYMWKQTLLPPASEIPKLMPRRQNGKIRSSNKIIRMLKGRLLAPIYIWKAMAQDYGHAPLVGVMTVLNVLIMTKNILIIGLGQSGLKVRETALYKVQESME